ncbi:MAG TPA: DUF883 domain-containing protein [Verrucomicrobiae bacterium]|jgi:ElaB/YqjD/DUF883 family membrane-anchored ribosome-binding protein|nr:DUF883 domain-containing protein [Verrucomicrobiae bacterium]
MSKHNHKHSSGGTSAVAEDAAALLAATAGVQEKSVEEARDRLAAALESARDTVLRVRDRAIEKAKATDVAVRENPYQAIAICLGIGALLGYIVGRRGRNND